MTENKAEGNDGLDLDMSDLDPEEALRGFMEVDPEKVKKRLGGGNDSGRDED